MLNYILSSKLNTVKIVGYSQIQMGISRDEGLASLLSHGE